MNTRRILFIRFHRARKGTETVQNAIKQPTDQSINDNYIEHPTTIFEIIKQKIKKKYLQKTDEVNNVPSERTHPR